MDWLATTTEIQRFKDANHSDLIRFAILGLIVARCFDEPFQIG